MSDQQNSPKTLSPKAEDRRAKTVEKQRQIKEVKTKLQNLSPKAAAEAVEGVISNQARKQVSGFRDFIREQGVVGVGVGLVIGIQVKAVVDTIMASLVNPITGLLLPGKETLSSQDFTLSLGSKHVAIGWGAIVYSLFTFLMVAFLVYVGYKLLQLDKLTKKKDEPKPVEPKPVEPKDKHEVKR